MGRLARGHDRREPFRIPDGKHFCFRDVSGTRELVHENRRFSFDGFSASLCVIAIQRERLQDGSITRTM